MQLSRSALAVLILAAVIASAPAGLPAQGMASPWPQTIVDDPGREERRELLVSHGINPLPADLIRFLREGFPTGGSALPAEPRLKVSLLDAAIAELGLTAATEAGPVLIEIAERKGPPGVTSILRRDVEELPIEAAEAQMVVARRVLSLNAIVALGLVGDASAAPSVLAVMRGETGTAFVTKGAESLALMGSMEGLPLVVALASDPAADDSVSAFRTVFVITGRNYGYTANTPLARRRELISQLRVWSESPEAALAPTRADVLRRQRNPPQPEVIDPSSLRGLLRINMELGGQTREDFDRRYEARMRLMEVAPTRYEELSAIARDPNEELDIRRSAIRWLALSNPRRAQGVVKSLRKDENPSVAETARLTAQDIPQYIDEARRRGEKP